MHRSTPRITYANVMSTVAVVIAIGGGTAFAATTLITGKEIKNSSITGVDVRNGSLGAVDLSPAARRTLTGARGATGVAGPAGPAGRSALTPLASGEQITGGFVIDTHATGGAQDFRTFVPFPMTAPANPTVVLSTADSTCTGSIDLPTAPVGKVCVYVATSVNGTAGALPGENAAGGAAQAVGSTARRQGFLASISSTSSGDVVLVGSWAYTAP